MTDLTVPLGGWWTRRPCPTSPPGPGAPFSSVPPSTGVPVDAVAEYAIFRLDRGGAVQTWNRGAQRIKGYTADEILGQHLSVFYPREERRRRPPGQPLG